MTPVTPPIDCVQIKIAGVLIGARKTAREKIRELRVEFCQRHPQSAGGSLWRNIAGFDAEAHFNVLSQNLVLDVDLRASDPQPDVLDGAPRAVHHDR
jgi:hypothetical protein